VNGTCWPRFETRWMSDGPRLLAERRQDSCS